MVVLESSFGAYLCLGRPLGFHRHQCSCKTPAVLARVPPAGRKAGSHCTLQAPEICTHCAGGFKSNYNNFRFVRTRSTRTFGLRAQKPLVQNQMSRRGRILVYPLFRRLLQTLFRSYRRLQEKSWLDCLKKSAGKLLLNRDN